MTTLCKNCGHDEKHHHWNKNKRCLYARCDCKSFTPKDEKIGTMVLKGFKEDGSDDFKMDVIKSDKVSKDTATVIMPKHQIEKSGSNSNLPKTLELPDVNLPSSLSDNIRKRMLISKDNFLLEEVSAFLDVIEDLKATLKKVMETEEVYWRCNECKTMWINGAMPEVCSCGNNTNVNSTKVRFVKSYDIKQSFGSELI